MAYSPDEGSTGRLLSKLAESLFQRYRTGELRGLGWFQYRDHDRADTLVATELASDAFLYLGLDEAGSWRDQPKLAIAVVMFLRHYYPGAATPADCARLMALVTEVPVDRAAVVYWFRATFPPTPTSAP
jgi:hypothetical protein